MVNAAQNRVGVKRNKLIGYDMYWEDPLPPELELLRETAENAFYQRVAERDAVLPRGTQLEGHPLQEAVHVAWATMQARAINYFRLNIWGMNEAREWLLKGHLLHEKGAVPSFPGRDDYGDDEAAYDAACERTVSAGIEYPGIPWWKLSDNSGWHVTPMECTSAMALAAEHEKDLAGAPIFVQEFIAWIATAGEHGGFRVY